MAGAVDGGELVGGHDVGLAVVALDLDGHVDEVADLEPLQGQDGRRGQEVIVPAWKRSEKGQRLAGPGVERQGRLLDRKACVKTKLFFFQSEILCPVKWMCLLLEEWTFEESWSFSISTRT